LNSVPPATRDTGLRALSATASAGKAKNWRTPGTTRLSDMGAPVKDAGVSVARMDEESLFIALPRQTTGGGLTLFITAINLSTPLEEAVLWLCKSSSTCSRNPSRPNRSTAARRSGARGTASLLVVTDRSEYPRPHSYCGQPSGLITKHPPSRYSSNIPAVTGAAIVIHLYQAAQLTDRGPLLEI